jgi:putative oxidoreductase
MDRHRPPGPRSGPMKRILMHPIVQLLLRVLLGGMFIIASLDKIVDPSAFAASILNYQLIGFFPAMIVATILPWVELLAGLGLLLNVFPRGSALLVSLLMFVFAALVGIALARGLDISCGCFSQDPAAGKIGIQKVAENLAFFLLSLISLFGTLKRTANND